MQLKTRFIITIAAVLIGFLTISSQTVFLLVGLNRLNRADSICHTTINSLKQLQLTTSQLLTTNELDKTFVKWKQIHEKFHRELERLNTSPDIHGVLAAREKENIIDSMNMFWTFTEQKTQQVHRNLTALLAKSNQSRDGLIFQYADSKDHELLIIRNDIYSALLFLEAEFETKLSMLIAIVEQEKAKRFKRLIIQVTVVGLVIALVVSTILTSFLSRLGKYLDTLYHTMKLIGKGDFTQKLAVPSDDELSRISFAINKTTDALGDIHEELEQRLHEISIAKEKAEVANRTKSIFLANMSHEIRTPLNAVIGFSELLSSLVADKKQQSYLTAIRSSGKNLLVLINDILDLSKIEANKLELQYSPSDLRTILNDVIHIFSMQALKKKIEFFNDIDKALPNVVLIDEIRVRQILFNVIGNAVKFTQIGHIRLSVKVQGHDARHQRIDLHISVEDTGLGIPEHEIDRIFDSFEQQNGQDPSVYGGTGLGLTISKRLVEMMNGQIRVESHVNRGSTFHILLKDVEASYEKLPITQNTIDPDLVLFEKSTVLVVDDVDSQLKLLRSLLSRVNVSALVAVNGQDAISKAREFLPDLILMDIRMPIMDGVTAARQLKTDSKTRHIPIIAVTASSTGIDSSDFIEKSFDGFLSKPIDINRLFSELSNYLPIKQPVTVGSEKEAIILPNLVKTILPDIIKTLESDFLDRWKQFQERQPMMALKLFGEQIKSLGIDHGLDILTAYGDDLITHVDNFDIINIQSAIDFFPDIIIKLKAAE